MDKYEIDAVKEKLSSDMQALIVAGIALYGAVPREVPTDEEAVYRLCHHDFFGFTQKQAAEILGVDQSTIARKLKSLKTKAPQLFPILSKNVAAVYNKFVIDNMNVQGIANELGLHPKYCWRVLLGLWNNRKEIGLYFKLGARNRLHYRPWMDEHIKESF